MNKLFLRILVSTAIICLTAGISFSQNQKSISQIVEWQEIEISEKPNNESKLKIWDCANCQYNYKSPETPYWTKRIKLQSNTVDKVSIESIETSFIDLKDARSLTSLSDDFKIDFWVSQERNEFYLIVKIVPFRKNISGYEKLEKFILKYREQNIIIPERRMPTTLVSKLADGQLFKIEVTASGVYEIGSDFLQNAGLDIASIDPTKIQILGNGGGKLNLGLNEYRVDDLNELAIEVTGETDGSFDANDKIRFYAEGADVWKVENSQLIFDKNIYDQSNYYFLKIGFENGKRISSTNSLGSSEFSFNSFDHAVRYEEDKVNLLGEYGLTQGSGQDWYGDRYATLRSFDYSQNFNLPNLIPGSAAIKAAFAGRSGSLSNVSFRVNQENFNLPIGASHVEDVESIYAQRVLLDELVELPNGSPSIQVEYPDNFDSNVGWIDYVEISYSRGLRLTENQMHFQKLNSSEFNTAEFEFQELNDSRIWDITQLEENKELDVLSNGKFSFDTNNEVKRFIAFNSYLSPTSIQEIQNQNLHAIEDIELVIIYHPDFEEAAMRLKQHRDNVNPLHSVLVNINDVYNEFSSGRIDPTAIRNFAKMIYDRTDNFNYLLLFGDGTYDFRNIMPDVPNGNFIPTFQTLKSLDPVESFPSDDYYCLLSDNEGSSLRGELDIAVGRITAKNIEEANVVVNKIIHYETSPNTLGDWRLKLLFNADDEDSNTHLFQADDIATKTEESHPVFNQSKIFWDAYVQESTPGGDRYPDANLALNKAINSGVLLTNYLGHGGSKGWSQERVLKVNDIQGYTNYDKLTTFITATCSFTGYDDPAINTAGEICLSNPSGGAVALLTTTRAVYVSGNKRLTEAVYDTIFTREEGKYFRLGEIMRRAKNSNASDTLGTNARKFALIGDPTMKLLIPEFDIYTSSINGQTVTTSALDTIGALEKVTIEGFVGNYDGTVKTDFNGLVYPTIYDKQTSIETLSNDNTNKVKFDVYRNIIFKGTATVTNGLFSFSFVVPQDIDYSFGNGKISYYATDQNGKDASGFFTDLVIGGTSPNGVVDDQGPQIELFVENLSFEYGDNVPMNTTLIAKISDDNGINITGNSIGHDLTGILDENENQSFILNEFYQAEVDDYTSGTVEFPLTNLELGIHTLKVKAWDIANNSAEAMTEFVVTDSEESALKNVLNYPNPFTTNTAFQFNGDFGNGAVDVLVNIYTLSGKLVKTIEANSIASNGYISDINWNGKDDFEDNLAKGIYLYKIKARSDQFSISQESQFEKLVILK